MLRLQKTFLEYRRQGLENYLKVCKADSQANSQQSLLQLPDVCQSQALRGFLSQHTLPADLQLERNRHQSEGPQDLINRLYAAVSDGFDELMGNLPLATAVSSGQRADLSAKIAESRLKLSSIDGNNGDPFVKPICDLILELFDLQNTNNWFRGKAMVLLLQQFLGGTIERFVYKSMFTNKKEA